ncbi:MAG: hypothetical protein WAZ94_10885 [Phycisphaerales bacterium]
MKTQLIVCVAGVLAAVGGCEKQPEAKTVTGVPLPQTPAHPGPVQPAPEQSAAAKPSTGGASSVEVLGLKLAVPNGWKVAPPSNSMRLAELHVPGAGGDAAQACLVAFSSAGGTVQLNMDRWQGQVKGGAAGDRVEQQIGGMKVTTAEFVGTYAGMGEGPAKEGWMLRGSIVETPAGLLFIKMTGPKAAMEDQRDAFHAMVRSIAKP